MPQPLWKEPRRALNKVAKARQTRAADEQARKAVRYRDHYTCRLCGRKTSVVHEHKRRGAGGKVTLQNSFCLCSVEDGGLCHDLVGTRWVYPVMVDGAETFDASRVIVFHLSRSTATRIFGTLRSIPSHVLIVEGLR